MIKDTASRSRVNSKTFPLEAPAQQRPNLRFVIDDQDVLVAAAP